jgi:trans-2,3-dihydro-3-hydroxyanthranilate isomerase
VTDRRFLQLDVFTSTPLSGNALAVFPDARGLEPETMQALAREMNLSETTFVLPSERATRRVRFFTPTAEIPLAGHPTIGTWWLLAELGTLALPDSGETEVLQETDAGILPVRIRTVGGQPVEVTMVQAPPVFGATVDDTEGLARVLGGGNGLIGPHPVPQVVSTALPQLMVPIRSLTDLQGLPSGGAGGSLHLFLQQFGTECAMCYTLETETPEATVHCRMFAPGLGVPEDPATGSAAGALGAYLVHHHVAPLKNGQARIVVEQGIEIDRPSRINVTVLATEGDPAVLTVEVGGTAVTVIEGHVRL